MAIDVIQAFPINFFETLLDDQTSYKILEEIRSKKEKIITSSSAYTKQSMDDYLTDYFFPVELETFSEVHDVLKEVFMQEHQLSFELHNYWTAIYKNAGYHSMHTHSTNIFSREPNYSGILYLSEIGATQVFSERIFVTEPSYTSKSKFGKIFCFPSKLVHQYVPVEHIDEERYVVPFNFNLYHV